MPTINRRSFLQMISAAGLTPALPAFGTKAAMAATPTSAQLLWAGIQSRARHPAAFNGVAKTMGISGQTAQGIYAKALQTQAMSGHAATTVRRLARQNATALEHPPTLDAASRQPVTVDLDVLQTEGSGYDTDLHELDTLHDADTARYTAEFAPFMEARNSA